MALSPALTIMLGFVIYENRTSGLTVRDEFSITQDKRMASESEETTRF